MTDEPKMTLSQIKQKMLHWRDFHGGDIMYAQEIRKAKSKSQLSIIMDDYYRHLEDVGKDALTHCEEFKRTLGLED